MKFLKPSFNILNRFYKDRQVNLKLLTSRQLKQKGDKLSRNDLSAVTRIVYGVVRHDQQIEFILQQVSNRKLKKIHDHLLVLLKMGAYLLMFSDSYPEYAITNEVVALSGGKTRGFVNALLRNITKQEEKLRASLNNVKALEIKYCMPFEIIENLKLISNNLEQDLHYLNREPLFHLRINHRSYNLQETEQLLKEHNIPAQPMALFNCFELKEAGTLVNHLINSDRFYFQNTASQLIAMIAARFADKQVLDCCAAPGTKSISMALDNPGLTIYANDINPGRAKLIKDFVHRYQLEKRVHTFTSDAGKPAFKGNFDFILIDAPCTSAGTLRKNPDLKLKMNQRTIETNALRQERILKEVFRASITNSRPTHILYTVCSFMQQETENVMNKIMNSEPGKQFKQIDLTPILDELGFTYKQGEYGVYLLPNEKLNNDLFYLSLVH